MHSEILVRDIAADVILYVATVGAYERGAWRRHMGLDVVSYDAVITACESGSRWHIVSGVFFVWRRRRSEPGLFLHIAAIGACGMGARRHGVLGEIVVMNPRGSDTDLIPYNFARMRSVESEQR